MTVQDRRKALLGFGVLAAVLIVGLVVLWPPPYFDKGGATGAIGAVEKHRETQITPQDVILGDEATRQQEDILYADLLKDAAKLQNISVELNAQLRDDEDLQARATAVRTALQAHEADLELRYARVRQVTDEFSLNLRDEELEAKAAAAKKLSSVDELQRALRAMEARKALRDEDVEELSAHLVSVAAELQAARLSAAKAYLDAIALERKALKSADEQLSAYSGGGAGKVNMQDISARLLGEADALEGKAVGNLQSRLASESELASRLNIIAVLIGNSKEMVATRSAALDSRAQARFNAALQNAEKALVGRKAGEQQLEARINYELAAIERYMENLDQIEARIAGRERPRRFRKYLADLDQAFAKQAVFASLAQRDKLAMQVRELGRRAEF